MVHRPKELRENIQLEQKFVGMNENGRARE